MLRLVISQKTYYIPVPQIEKILPQREANCWLKWRLEIAYKYFWVWISNTVLRNITQFSFNGPSVLKSHQEKRHLEIIWESFLHSGHASRSPDNCVNIPKESQWKLYGKQEKLACRRLQCDYCTCKNNWTLTALHKLVLVPNYETATWQKWHNKRLGQQWMSRCWLGTNAVPTVYQQQHSLETGWYLSLPTNDAPSRLRSVGSTDIK